MEIKPLTRWQKLCDLMWWTRWHFVRLFDPLVAPERYRREMDQAFRARMRKFGVDL